MVKKLTISDNESDNESSINDEVKEEEEEVKKEIKKTKPKKILSQKQIDALKRGREKIQQNVQERLLQKK